MSAGGATSWPRPWTTSGLIPQGKVCLDAGASTGGFSQVLLLRGAARVYAVDVGYGQLDPIVRNDPRVVVLERTNIRLLPKEAIPEPVDLATLDLSFISLTLVLPKIVEFIETRRGDPGPGEAPV